MTDHVDLDVLAALSEGLLDSAEAGQAQRHLRGCTTCTARAAALGEVPAALRRVSEAQPPPVPAWVAERLDAALAAEAGSDGLAAGAGSGLAAEARPDLAAPTPPPPDHVPAIADARQRRRRGHWPASGILRPLGAAAAVCLLAGGGYALFRAATPSATSTAASAPHRSAAATAPANRANPLIRHQATVPGATSPEVLRSGINYQPTQLQGQVESVLRQTSGERHYGGTGQHFAQLPADLRGCVQRVIGDQQPTLVDEASYRGQSATVIVTPEANGPGGEVWVAGSGCSAGRADVLAQTSVSTIP